MKSKHVGFEVRTLSNLIHRKINQMVAEEEETLTASQAWVLGFLVRQGEREVVQRDIEKEFSIRRSTASHMTDEELEHFLCMLMRFEENIR